MNGNETEAAARQRWQRHFAEVLVSGDAGEVNAATEAAVATVARGGGDAAARTAGRLAAKRYREGRRGGTTRTRPARPAANGSPVATASAGWPGQIATRLFATPARWGWRAATPPAAPPAPELAPERRPMWVEPPRPDASHLRRARSAAVTRLVWRLAFSVLVVFAFVAFRGAIEQEALGLGEEAASLFPVAMLVGGGLLGFGAVRGAARVASASRAIQAFEQPYQALRATERRRYEQAVADWEVAVAQHRAAVARAQQPPANGPLWYPVRPASAPTRVDVVGGDPRRHGWASLLVTLGSSILAGGERVTLLDFTGEDAAGGLVAVARANGLATRRVDLADGMFDVTLLDGFRFHRLTRIPRDGETDRRDPDARDRTTPALLASLTGAHADLLASGESDPGLLAGWVRPPRDQRLRLLVGGRPGFPPAAVGPGPERPLLFPPGAAAVNLPGAEVAELLDQLPYWVPCTGQPDALWAAEPRTPVAPRRGSFDRHVAHLGEPFAWLVLAQPMVARETQPELDALVAEILPLTRGEISEAKRVGLERKQARHRELSRWQADGCWGCGCWSLASARRRR